MDAHQDGPTADDQDTADRTRAALERVVASVPGDPLLRPPATVDQLDAAQEHLGRPLPADVRALYLLHDGQVQHRHDDPRWAAGLLGGEPLLPLQDVLFHWDQWAGFEDETGLDEGVSSEPEGFARAKYSLRGWIPLTHDGGGNHVGIDLDPDVRGTVGQVLLFGRDDEWHRVLAPSLRSYLEQLADLLDRGHGQPDGEGWSLSAPDGAAPHTLFRPRG
ncbi:SMI1/KNR4 family protein [Kineococcus rhizosphaerae]|uniref:Cell wall assembly regulator SMI1 n=1 Tax=Kineococcus rhizosphaerae TaxID=559628 RepID=A0A2T0R218_9ACTN|nr:SMI1/KNR4 family protein [Kineococcus rhizosphaerae]PRY13553.1 cell wall assembly regulator SMI1 [Kineococcus rhizosphaerae]